MDSEALGARLARREEAALEEAYLVYGPAMLTYLRRFVGVDEAEDVLQRTFLDAWHSAGRYEPRLRLSSWLFTIAHHRAVDALRRRRTAPLAVEALRGLPGEDGRVTADRHAEAAEVRAALLELPEHERVVLELVYYGDLSQREVAERLDVPLGTVKARASRGTRHLGAIIGRQRGSQPDSGAVGNRRRGEREVPVSDRAAVAPSWRRTR